MQVKPSIEEIKVKFKSDGKKVIIPFWTEIIADLETPVSAYNKVAKGEEFSFLLESVEGGEALGRYSFIGFDPLFVLKSGFDKSVIFDYSNKKDILEAENPYSAFDKFFGSFTCMDFDIPLLPGAVGYFGYDTVRFIEPKLIKSFEKNEKCQSFPDSYFMIGGINLAFDHVKRKIYIICNVLAENLENIEQYKLEATEKIKKVVKKLNDTHSLKPFNLNCSEKNSEISSNISKEAWVQAVNKAKDYILAGDIFQVVLSQRFCIEKESLDNFTIYRALRHINPSPYLYYLDFKDFQIIGSSPEALVKCSKDKKAFTRPIAGTRRRGYTPERDKELELELINDPKERAEHVMLVDLARNDIGKVSKYGSVKVERFMEVERFSHVMHIVSDVTGELKDDKTSIDLLRACFPAGTVSGAPKVRAMEIIYELESSARGPYAGCIGYVGFNNELNVAITLRTMLVKDNNIFIQAGAGIVADSEPDLEFLETQNKAAALVQAVNQLKN